MTNVQAKTGHIRYQSLSDKVTETLRDAIVRGDYNSGTKLTEENCAQEMGVSRACIREAFITLESEGLLQRKRNKCTEVLQLNDRDVRDIVELISAIEVLATKTCIARNTVPQQELLALATKIANLSRKRSIDVTNLVKADFDFHEMILQAAGNKKSLAVWYSLKSQMKMLQYRVLKSDQIAKVLDSAYDHEAIVKAMINRDIKEALALVRLHIGRSSGITRARITQKLDKVNANSPNTDANKPPTTRWPFSTRPGE